MFETIEIKKLTEDAIIPTKGSRDSAGFDLYANRDAAIEPGETTVIGTGVSMSLPVGTFGGIFARSGLATKQGLRPANCVGVCDSDYTGEYMIALHNDSKVTQEIKKGDRIAQLVILPFVPCSFIGVDELEATERGEGGFGSTGVN